MVKVLYFANGSEISKQSYVFLTQKLNFLSKIKYCLDRFLHNFRQNGVEKAHKIVQTFKKVFHNYILQLSMGQHNQVV